MTTVSELDPDLIALDSMLLSGLFGLTALSGLSGLSGLSKLVDLDNTSCKSYSRFGIDARKHPSSQW